MNNQEQSLWKPVAVGEGKYFFVLQASDLTEENHRFIGYFLNDLFLRKEEVISKMSYLLRERCCYFNDSGCEFGKMASEDHLLNFEGMKFLWFEEEVIVSHKMFLTYMELACMRYSQVYPGLREHIQHLFALLKSSLQHS